MSKVKKNRDSALIYTYLFRALGDWAFRFAVPLFLYAKTNSALGTALGYILTFLPQVLFAIPAGVMADRYDKRTLLWLLDLVGFASCLILAFQVHHQAPISTIYTMIFVISSIGTFYHAVFQGSIPIAIGKQRLHWANSMVNAGDSLLSALGPIIGALAVVVLGYEFVIYLNAFSYLVAVIVTLRCIHFVSIQVRNVHVGHMLKEGAKAISRDDFLKFGVLLFMANNFAMFLYLGVFVYHLKHNFGLSDLAVGAVCSVGGAAAIAGSFMAKNILDERIGALKKISILAILLGVATLFMAINQPVFFSVAWAMVNFVDALIMVTYFTERQIRVPGELLGRVVSFSRMVAYVAIPLGAGVGALAVGYISIPSVIIVSGILMTIFGASSVLFCRYYPEHAL
ncbi:MFS transporter [Salmonella enterica subsp. diarizonae]|uniref:MFS transporter n=1 Tax=Salmonella diarizonae TaxID=59204 RepID=A0A627WZA8_SALDZ|nr:MFS transporter [Salmonella enterica subsp. diarizonae]